MTWAGKRKAIIFSLIGIVILLAAFGGWYFFIRHAPSCIDHTQNQGEEGIDCGGPCQYQCIASHTLPIVRFARALSPVPGRTDVIAYIDNTNADVGAREVTYTAELYDSSNVLISKKQGMLALTPSATVPLFMPNFFSGSYEVTHVFLTIDQDSLHWVKQQRSDSPLSVTDVLYGEIDSPRVTAVLRNSSATDVRNAQYVATLFGPDGNAIAASSTIVPDVPAQGSTSIVFTWPSAIPTQVTRIEVLPGIAAKP